MKRCWLLCVFNSYMDPMLNPRHYKLLYGMSTFYRRYSLFQTTGELPLVTDYRIKVGVPPILHHFSIQDLIAGLKNIIGFSEKNN